MQTIDDIGTRLTQSIDVPETTTLGALRLLAAQAGQCLRVVFEDLAPVPAVTLRATNIIPEAWLANSEPTTKRRRISPAHRRALARNLQKARAARARKARAAKSRVAQAAR